MARETRRLQSANVIAVVLCTVAVGSAGCTAIGVHDSPAPREWYREGTGRTVVMLGGGLYGAAMFTPHAKDLSRDFEVIRVQTLNVQNAATGAPIASLEVLQHWLAQFAQGRG